MGNKTSIAEALASKAKEAVQIKPSGNKKKASLYKRGDNDEQKQRLTVYGYVKDITNKTSLYDHTDIISIILSYYQQGFAKYFDQKLDANCNHKMEFGDILRSNDDKYMVMNIENKLESIGEIEYRWDDLDILSICIVIPLSICQYLTNAPAFYSKFDEREPFKNAFPYELKLYVKNDDECVIQHFGDSLSQSYGTVLIKFSMHEFRGFEIGINEETLYPFNPIENEISCKDIDNFFELRKPQNMDKLIVLRVEKNDKLVDLSFINATCTDAVSILWSMRDQSGVNTDYAGPKTEQFQMESHLRAFYKSKEIMVNISAIEVLPTDISGANFYFDYKPVRVLL